ncbi:hypothetical protein JCGZ_08352 [Jatropha curcas]|uniref:Uncharacterized protein n=1 Tax=Jatropha curcas TaxID=180498 RepID=A0A067KWE0_JATCU|nr:hypothetical protein JCGZ_08352 [Jatropha curcas]
MDILEPTRAYHFTFPFFILIFIFFVFFLSSSTFLAILMVVKLLFYPSEGSSKSVEKRS